MDLKEFGANANFLSYFNLVNKAEKCMIHQSSGHSVSGQMNGNNARSC